MRGGIAFLAIMLMLSGCSAVQLVNDTAWRDGLAIRQDVAYAPGPRHRLDVYSRRDSESQPVAVFFYGGGWTAGSKDQYAFVATALAQRGIVTVVPDYRIYPAARFPGFIEDGAEAVRWAHDHAAEYGGDPRRLFLIGHSAGAYIAAMLALDPDWLKAVGLDPARDVAGSVGLAGPYDFLPLRDATLEAIFAPSGDLPRSQPIHFVHAEAPPLLLLAGDRDDTVDPANATRLAAAQTAAGGRARAIIYRGVGHRPIIAAFAWSLRFLAPSFGDTLGFVADGAATPPDGAKP
jgi:acetyl esterase/lipase